MRNNSEVYQELEMNTKIKLY